MPLLKSLDLANFFENFFKAIRFLSSPSSVKTLSRSSFSSLSFFPAIGFLIGLVSLWAYVFMHAFLSERASNLMLILVPIVLTRGAPLLGFSRFCDAFSGSREERESPAVSQEAPVGFYGMLATFLLLLTQFEILQDLPNKSWAFLFALSASRWSEVVLLFYLPCADSGKSLNSPAGKEGNQPLLAATAILFFVTLPLSWSGLYAFLILLVFLFLLGVAVKRAVAHLTPEFLGAVSELSELLIFVLLTILNR